MVTFKNQPTLLNKVCKECDTVIGESEALLSKCTIEGVLLKHIRVVGRHKGNSSSPFRSGHSGHPPIKLTTVIPGYNQPTRVEPIGDSHNVDIAPQLILIDEYGNYFEPLNKIPEILGKIEDKSALPLLKELLNILPEGHETTELDYSYGETSI